MTREQRLLIKKIGETRPSNIPFYEKDVIYSVISYFRNYVPNLIPQRYDIIPMSHILTNPLKEYNIGIDLIIINQDLITEHLKNRKR